MELEPLLPVAKGQKATYLENWTTLPWKDLAEAVKANNGGNVGLRLDLYFVLDPDCPEAEALCNELDANGEIPQTVKYKTASGYTGRIFTPPPGRNHKALDIKNGLSLELRHGTGQYCVIPPSYLAKSKSGKPGHYQWVTGHSPDDIEPSEFPLELYERLQEMEKAGETSNPNTTGSGKPASLNFTQGSRDNSIYSVALALRKSGMPESDILASVEALAAGCNPPFSPKEAARKVQAALKNTPSERHLAQEINDYIEEVTGSFSTSELDRELGINSKTDKSNRRKVLYRLAKNGEINRDMQREGYYFKPSDECEVIDPFQVDDNQEFPLVWPFNIHSHCFLCPENIAVVTGSKDSGKTALLLNLALMNSSNQVSYFNSEMSKAEINLRLSKFGYGERSWRHVEWIVNYDSQNVENLIRPGNINIIDYLEEPAEVWKLGIQISRIRKKLGGGIAVIGLQKDPGKAVARGGFSTMQKARIYLTMEKGIAKLEVGKLWRTPGKNPKGLIWNYKLVDGCKFIIQ